eukprot:Nk52_evm10s226 gene=Nk52_evmTU10s226
MSVVPLDSAGDVEVENIPPLIKDDVLTSKKPTRPHNNTDSQETALDSNTRGKIPCSLRLPSFRTNDNRSNSRLEEFIAKCFSCNCTDEELFKLLHSDVIGAKQCFKSPFGYRNMMYADYFASGRSLAMVEEFVAQEVLPFYGNTHSEQSIVAVSTHSFRKDSRDFIKYHMAGEDLSRANELQVVFCGSGATAACNTLVHMFGLRTKSRMLWDRVSFDAHRRRSAMNAANYKNLWSVLGGKLKRKSVRPVVFLSLVEHNSNLLPWRVNSFADVVYIPFDPITFQPDMDVLRLRLKEFHDRPLKIGSFSAGSNIVGVPIDTHSISILLHEHGAYAVFDYAGVGAYQTVDMFGAQSGHPMAYKDAVMFSPHKMIGGPQGSGLLIMQKELMRRLTFEEENDVEGLVDIKLKNKDYMMKLKDKMMAKVAKKNKAKKKFDVRHEHIQYSRDRNPLNVYTPSKVGGGVVDFTSVFDQVYLAHDREGREEAGTPGIVSDIRAGLALRVQSAIGLNRIIKRDHQLWEVVRRRLLSNPDLELLGSTSETVARVPVVSFRVRSRVGMSGDRVWVHHNFVAALLNDLFGIQARSGCMCAGLLTAELLDISDEEWLFYEDMFTSPHHDSRSKQHFELCKPGFTRLAFSYIVTDAERDFMLDAIEWVSQNAHHLYPFYQYDAATGAWSATRAGEVQLTCALSHEACLKEADKLVQAGKSLPSSGKVNPFYSICQNDSKLQKYRWFVLPEDITSSTEDGCTGASIQAGGVH